MKPLKIRLLSRFVFWKITGRSNIGRVFRCISVLSKRVQKAIKPIRERFNLYRTEKNGRTRLINPKLYYRIIRLLIAIAIMEVAACVVILSNVWSPWPFLILAAAFGYFGRNSRKKLWAHGTAQWSSEDELRRAGMIGGNKGLAIGRLGTRGHSPLVPRILSIIDPRMAPKDACERFMSCFPSKRSCASGEVVRLANSVHTAVFGPTGSGKGASFIIPWLLEMDESAVVLDYKGENAAITCLHRMKNFGHHCVLLDPFHVVTRNSDCLNPLDFIDRDSPTLIDDCRDLAEQLVLRTGEEREPHWNESAEMWIASTCIGIALHAEKEDRSLQAVRDVLSNPDKIPKLIELLCNSEGMVPRLGGQLAHFRDKELSSTLTTVNRHLRFLDTPAVAAITAHSSFNPRSLRDGKMTVYCILPVEHMRAQTSLVRIWIGTLMRAVVQGGLQRG